MTASDSQITSLLCLAVAVVSIGSGFQHGYNTGVLNTPEEVIKGWMSKELDHPSESQTKILWSTVVSIFCIGGMIGGGFAGLFANGLGRKYALMVNNIFVFAASILLGITRTTHAPYLLMVGRFIVGINCGMNAALAPLYINEISPTKIRGATGSLYQLNITIAILISQILGSHSILGTETLWPFLLGLIGIVGFLQLVFLFFCPESPKHLLEKKNDEEGAKHVLEKLVGGDSTQQFLELKNDIEDAKSLPKVTFSQMLSQRKLRMPLIIISVLMVGQQLSGVNAVIFYSTEIFKMGKLSSEAAQYSTIGVGVVNVLTTCVSVWLVEKCGRKVLLLVAFGGVILSMTVLFICLYFVGDNEFAKYLSIVMVFIYLIFFAIGAGSIPWLLGPELFNTAARPLAISIAVPINWLFTFAVGLLFPPLQAVMGPAVFVIFIVCSIGTFLFVWIWAPETKNRTIDEITASFG